MLSIVNGDGNSDNFNSIVYNLEQSLMSKVKHNTSEEEKADAGNMFQTYKE